MRHISYLLLFGFVFAPTVFAGNGDGACAGSSLNFKYLTRPEGQTPEQYIEELTNEVKKQPFCGGEATCSHFAEYAIRRNLGDYGDPQLPSSNPEEGRQSFQIVASLHRTYTLEINSVKLEKATAEELKNGLDVDQTALKLRLLYESRKVRHSIDAKLNSPGTHAVFQGGVMDGMEEGEIMSLKVYFFRIEESHMVSILRTKTQFLLMFGEEGLVLTSEKEGLEALNELTDAFREINPDYEIDPKGMDLSIRIVN